MEQSTGSLGAMLIVVGMHRSGTSAMTGALQCLDVKLGRQLYGGHDRVNAKGYFENSVVADTNDEILARIGSSWDDILGKAHGWWDREDLQPFSRRLAKSLRKDFGARFLWAIKDPRVCRLLPYWLPLLHSLGARPHFLFAVRPADEVHASLMKRDGFSRNKSFFLWSQHYLEAEMASRSYPRVFVSFDRLLQAPVESFERVESQLGINFPVAPRMASGPLKQFLSPDLRHHQAPHHRDESSAIARTTYALQRVLLEEAQDTASAGTEQFDELRHSLTTIVNGFDPLLVEHMRVVASTRGDLQLVVNRLLRSGSYFAGKPIRVVERLLGRMV